MLSKLPPRARCEVDAVGELRVAQGNHISMGGNLILLKLQHREHVNLARVVLHFADAFRLKDLNQR